MSEEETVNSQEQQQGATQEADPGSQEKEDASEQAHGAGDKGGAAEGEGESAAAEEDLKQSSTKEGQGEAPPSLPTAGEEKEEVDAQTEFKQGDAVGEDTQHKEEHAVQPIERNSAKSAEERTDGEEKRLQGNEGGDDKERQPKSTADEGVTKPESQYSPRDEKTAAESTSELETHPPKAAAVDKLELQSSAREERTAGESTSEMDSHPPKTADKKKKKKPKSRVEPGDSKPMPRLKRRSSQLESAGGKSVTGSITTSDLFDDVVRDMFSIADAQQKGHLTREEFESFLNLEHFSGCLDQPDYSQSLQYFDSSATDGQLAYDMFAPVARELILRVYQVRDTSGSDWVQLSTAQGVNFWLNKFNGETRIVDEAPLAERQEEIDFMNQVYSQLDATQTELEQEKTRNKELTNQSYHFQEELEKAHEALYTTGQTLDDTSAELETKSSEIAKLKEVLEAKETDSQKMQKRIAELEQLAEALQSTKRELNDAKSLVSRQEGRLMEKDAALTQLQNKCDNTVEQLKSATGVIDARDSSVRNLTKALDGEKKRVKEFEHHVPQVEERLRNAEEELAATKQQLEEKIRALQTTRKQLKSTRDRNMELEKDIEKLLVVKEKCIDAEGEIRTLKSFLVSKTSIVEKKKNEVKELQAQMMEMEKKDEKRAIILASVLEKTARMQQSASEQHVPSHGMPLHRSTSAPSLLPDSGEDVAQLRVAQSKRKAHTTSKAAKPWTTGPPPPHTSRTGKARKKGKKVQTLPRLPPVMSSHLDKKEFSFPTLADIKHSQKLQDAVVVEHSSSNLTCRCAMCMLHESAIASVAEAGLQTAAAVTGLSGLGSLAKQHGDEMEMQLSKKLHLGDRVIVQLKRTMYDLEPRKLTGTVKYVGKVDREYVDNRVYVGVRLDDPVGDSDGLFKGKRYFTCTPKHGKMVRINNVIAVLYPKMGTAYQPLVCPQQKTPYNLGSLAGDTMLQLPVN